jgi:hypothetical protein
MHMLTLALALLSGPAAAGPYRPFSAQFGIGNRYGMAGIGGTWRFHEDAAVVLGAGVFGVGGALRGYYWKSLYAQLGVAPLLGTEDGSLMFYGPDIATGVDLRHQRVSFTAGLGMGVVYLSTGLAPTASLDLGVGVNLGKLRGTE